MNQNKGRENTNRGNNDNQRELERDQQGSSAGQAGRDRSEADDQGLRRKPESEPAIPDTPDSDNDDLGNEGRRGGMQRDSEKHTEATMPPGEGQNPKRNTM